MFIMPAVDIKNGKCVQLVQGKPGTEQIVLENPAEVAKGWEDRGASVLHVIDLGGALEEGGNIPVVEEILKKVSIPVQMGGGIRSIDDAAHLLDIGVDRVILGTLAIQEPESVEILSQEFGSQRIMVALDSKDSKVVVRGWTEKTNQTAPELGKTMEERGAGGILFTNVDHEGLLGGFKVEPLLELMESVSIPVVYSGGVSTLEDVALLSQTGCYGVVIGSALYKGTLNFEKALDYEK
ncbi:MAG: phosphoribosylformimino-5-aminoimidazole carboxamide ribotide isomerase [Methanobacterium sp.]|jgi:phosphoribosylformimino-5-aminoimidazole carboxamide ribotide isomerase|uniref:1-(5-phosphoribosyl)-5-[(5- phosphoribosylamino)methylideneamino]imidazole-4- carboxamide isomerase n=1 Tax=Methanobacterium sp. TaxID=2164 RepID=UPI0003C9CA3E|nr:1-(5-phosphoribosyl)-5-[(5-phosphoribosylamino)methylideneamino]imidazole-4-carboxamide isomerase [Methanobacterium sp.]MDI3549508.1 phosphoribosylformimino-5-aminoimidazole carboxamide ribotide isomerase [Methanobacterium sp.]CDG64791.1 1-(5-phosphoribosyl)-5-[(5-phosphoribosylamino)methylideneamino] imidazole-4-carboxamide isomerase [Methanobacterium sp. MB1]